MLFVIKTADRGDAGLLRGDTRPAHVAYLTGLGAGLKLAGPFLDAASSPTGSLLIVEADDLAAAQKIADGDPYAKAGLFSSVTVTPWRAALGDWKRE